ncbi:MAG: hypothetical protein Barrevirus2_33 [Barrevirus sp.]|uniref:Uncharacterized protein n=1 Tax=Barrevirus sp. TaxID=2487763 RepID=A0A3G4ZPQ3_9VIRU|nr:MAG: hypothetical protein Barrevirus2_33 [Barrevirus sp.]
MGFYTVTLYFSNNDMAKKLEKFNYDLATRQTNRIPYGISRELPSDPDQRSPPPDNYRMRPPMGNPDVNRFDMEEALRGQVTKKSSPYEPNNNDDNVSLIHDLSPN